MRVLLTGAAGQLGQHLQASAPAGIDLVCSRRSGGEQACDLADRQSVLALLDRVEPQLIINAAAWTAVDAAEDHEEQARVLNADLPGWLADWARAHDAGLISYSTDYVFSGEPGRPWREDDPCDPQSAYGRTKRAGELKILESGARALILRTAWVYSALPGNFLSAIIARAAQGQDLRVVDDQIGSPTWAGSLAEASWRLVERFDRVDAPGILHVAGATAMSWCEFARRALDRAVTVGRIPGPVGLEAIASEAWPQKARRPAWSVLDVRRVEAWVGRPMDSVDEALQECFARWTTSQP